MLLNVIYVDVCLLASSYWRVMQTARSGHWHVIKEVAYEVQVRERERRVELSTKHDRHM